MTNRSLPTIDELRQLLRYEPETGKLFWLERGVESSAGKTFNKRYAGKEAFTASTSYGHKQGLVLQHHLLGHRVIWALVHGNWPKQMIDHIDGDPSNNRLVNLRDASSSQNQKNRKINCNNKTGVLGVKWREDRGKWRAEIRVDGVSRHLGSFNSFEDAVAARQAANIEYGYHRNHGRKA